MNIDKAIKCIAMAIITGGATTLCIQRSAEHHRQQQSNNGEMKQLIMNLNKATAEDILDVSQGMANGRSKVDIIKRKVGKRRNHGATSYESANIVAEQLQKVICYQKRVGCMENSNPVITLLHYSTHGNKG